MRSKNLDSRTNSEFNLVSGDQRLGTEVPFHPVYNPDPSGDGVLGIQGDCAGARTNQIHKVRGVASSYSQ
jgi:hypothetical protein